MHIHIPEGAIPKDGPSAGITLASALVSALGRIELRKDVAMTGEITLRGKVLPIGGVKEKVLAAHRAGLKNIILPKDNEKDLADIPKNVLDTLGIYMVETMDDVLKVALARPLASMAASRRRHHRPARHYRRHHYSLRPAGSRSAVRGLGRALTRSSNRGPANPRTAISLESHISRLRHQRRCRGQRTGIPRDGLPQVAMTGRSNVGKSTLLNALCRSKVARTSAAPGKTRLANIYRLVVEGGGPGKWGLYLVDLPGYGYARGGADAAEELRAVAEAYFLRARDSRLRRSQAPDQPAAGIERSPSPG